MNGMGAKQRITALIGLVLLVLAGLICGPTEARDSVALLAWCALTAPALGVLVAGLVLQSDPRLGPAPGKAQRIAACCLVPSAALIALLVCQFQGPRVLPYPLLGLAVLAGLYCFGIGLAAWAQAPLGSRPNQAAWTSIPLAASLLMLSLLLAGAPVLFGFAREGQSLGNSHPGLAELLLKLAPDGLALEVSGFDWSHSNPTIYGVSGIEWLLWTPRGGWTAGIILGLGIFALMCGLLLAKRGTPHQSEV